MHGRKIIIIGLALAVMAPVPDASAQQRQSSRRPEELRQESAVLSGTDQGHGGSLFSPLFSARPRTQRHVP